MAWGGLKDEDVKAWNTKSAGFFYFSAAAELEKKGSRRSSRKITMPTSSIKIVFMGLSLMALIGMVSCSMGSREICKDMEVPISGYHIDTLILDESVINRIYAADLRAKGTLVDSMLVNIWFSGSLGDSIHANSAKLMRIHLPPGSYDTLVFKGDWYGNPMVLESTGTPGAKLEFCATFFF